MQNIPLQSEEEVHFNEIDNARAWEMPLNHWNAAAINSIGVLVPGAPADNREGSRFNESDISRV